MRMNIVRSIWCIWALVACMSATVRAQPKIALRSQPWGRVEGQAFDSISMLPLSHAQVWIPGTTFSTVANDKGQFTLDSIPLGRQIIAFSTPALDSLGLGIFGNNVDVRASEVSRVALGSPSTSTIWKALCGKRPRLGPDSGVVWGTVRDAATLARLTSAPTLFNWYDMQVTGKKLGFSELSTEVDTDSTGTYYACGLPTRVALTSKALGREAASGDVEFAIGDRGVVRVDYLVSPDMKAHASLRSITTAQAAAPPARGSATITGLVKDELGRNVGDALVSVSSADTTVRSGSDGHFVIRGMPSGTHSVQVRGLGYGMSTRLIDLRPDAVADATFTLPLNTALDVFNVRADAVTRVDQSEYLKRRQLGFGYAIEPKNYGFADPVDAIRMAPRVHVSYVRGTPTVTMTAGAGSCTPRIYLDGNKTDIDAMTTFPVENIRAVEVFNNEYIVPARFVGNSNEPCGVILYWSRAKW